MTDMAQSPPAPHGSAREVLAVSLRLGLTSFGGPAAHIGYFRREYVERRRWVDPHAFGDLVALAQALPGPASSQLGIAIGTRRAGMLGGVAAWIGFTLPSAVLLTVLGLASATVDVSDAGWVRGLAIAAIAVVAQAVFSMTITLAPDLPRRLLAAGAFVLVLAWPGPLGQLVVIGGGAILGALVLASPPEPSRDALRSPVPPRVAVLCLAIFAVIVCGLSPLVQMAASDGLALFERMFRTGALVFGGGHVVLPLLDTAVVDPGWVPESRFLAGYGVAQAMPGPLFSVAAYLGAVADVAPGGVAGAVIALTGIFLPSFLLIWGVLPFWTRIRGSARARRAAAGVNAAVVGLLAGALVDLLRSGAIEGPGEAVIAGAATVLLFGRLPPVGVVGLCAIVTQALAWA